MGTTSSSNQGQQATQLDPHLQLLIDRWLQGPYDEGTKAEIRRLMRDEPAELKESFSSTLAFGTGGMRGKMGPGTNRFNIYTVRSATQGLANYLKSQPLPPTAQSDLHQVLIGHDSRHQARLFAEEAAQVLAGNGIQVWLCKELRPTPYVSFGCRHLGCSAALMITASHNPPAYNGYKVYWSDGAQVLPPHDRAIIQQVQAIESIEEVSRCDRLDHPLIKEVGDQLDEAYLATVAAQLLLPEQNEREGHRLRLIYTPLHGTGITLLPRLLHRSGFTDLRIVERQALPDGDFPTVKVPNPEEKEALSLAIEQLEQEEGDLLLATDPDADRVGIAVRHQGRVERLNGNQIACLCVWHICKTLSERGGLPQKAAFIKTLPTSELFRLIAEAYERPCYDVLTGFKYIASLIRSWEQLPTPPHQYLFGAEESYGYLLGDYARDKDGLEASALIAEIALQAKLQGKTLIDELHELWRTFGLWEEGQLSIAFEDTASEKVKMVQRLEQMRSSPPKQIGELELIAMEDYLLGYSYHSKGESAPLAFPKTDMLIWRLAGGDKVILRPSGTEPKVKIYASWHEPLPPHASKEEIAKRQQQGQQALQQRLEQIHRLFVQEMA